MNNERRKSSRTRLEKLTYVHLLPENGAIILNISEHGFGFHAVGPIHDTGPIRFSFSLQGDWIEAVGDLAWIDRKRKTGGLHLTEISTGVGHPLDVWLSRLRSAELQTMSLQKARPELRSISRAPENEIVPRTAIRAQFSTAAAHWAAVASEALSPRPSMRAETGRPEQTRRFTMTQRKARGTGPRLNAGVVAIAFIIFIAFAALLTHTSASRLDTSPANQPASFRGNSIAAKPSAQTVPSQSGLQGAPEGTQTSESLQELRTDIEALEKEYPNENKGARAGLAPHGDKPQQSDQSDANPDANLSARTVGAEAAPGPLVPANTDKGESSLGAESLPKSSPSSDAGGAANDGPAVQETPEANVDPATATYFDVGAFKDQSWAGKATDDLEKLGFHATVVHKNLLWMRSFHVLVGPFGNGSDIQAARAKLEKLGFSPRTAKAH